jgi:uncharacterized protein (TIGR02001 family)
MDSGTDVLRTRDARVRSPIEPSARPGRWMVLWATVLVMLPLCVCRADGPWGASIAATSDYILRGVSQTYGRAAVQLGANYQSPFGWFGGVWGSNVDPYPSGDASTELDFYAGFTRPLGDDFSARATYTHYTYLNDPRPVRYDYDDFALSVAYVDRLAATVSYQPDFTSYSLLGFAHKRPTVDYEVSSRWPVSSRFALIGGVGYYDLHHLFGVSYWSGSAGIAYVDRHLEVDLTRFFSDGTVARLWEDASADGDVVVSVVFRF